MSLLISAYQVDKTMGDQKLFKGLSFGIHEKEKIGLLGPNGAGKSTLLKILSGIESADSGEISPRKTLRMAYVPQEDKFEDGKNILILATEALVQTGMDNDEASVQASVFLSMAGFENFDTTADKLSGGWRKRLSLAIAMAKDPELLLLDEPTNHMDWDGILWLENLLKTFNQAFLLISHDREFLKNQCRQFMEINRVYKDGYLSLKCDYESFLQRKQEHIEAQKALQDSMANKARREVEWLRAGVKARTTKSQSRIKEAHQLLDDLDEVKSRNQAANAKVRMSIDAAGKRSKKFLETKKLSIAYGENTILEDLDLNLGPKTCLGVLGDNASGKTSLVKVLAKKADNYKGELFHAEDLKIVYFDQKRDSLNPNENILEFLGDGSDYVQFKGRSLHVASYASQFLFHSQKLNLPIHRLSGGEQARLLIAKLLLEPADLLVLDEPTNDLDIETIEILEQSLRDFPGLVLLVSHDRYFLKQSCQSYLALDGKGSWAPYADIGQWLKQRSQTVEEATPVAKKEKNKPKPKVKLSYKEKRAMETIEEDIAIAEQELQDAQKAVEENTDFSNHEKTNQLLATMNEKQNKVDDLYAFWQGIEEKLNP